MSDLTPEMRRIQARRPVQHVTLESLQAELDRVKRELGANTVAWAAKDADPPPDHREWLHYHRNELIRLESRIAELRGDPPPYPGHPAAWVFGRN